MSHLERSRRTIRFTREGWSFIAILSFVVIGAILRQINLLVMLAAMMIPALMFNWRLAVALVRRIRVTHSIPDWTFAGRTTTIELEVFNSARAFTAWNVLLTDRIQRIGPFAGSMIKPVDLVAVAVEAGQKTHVAYRCFFAERGVYRFGPVRIGNQHPFGLVRAEFDQPDLVELHVVPRLGELMPIWNKRLGALAVGMASAERRRGWLPEEFFGLRGWQHGDTTRWIHWRSTAKRGQVVVKQFDQPTDRDFALALDLYASPDAIDQSSETTELALSFVATVLARLNYSVQGRMAIAVCGTQASLFTNHVPGEFVGSVMKELAAARPGTGFDLAATLRELSTKVSPGTPLIVVTTRTAADARAALANNSDAETDRGWESHLIWIPVDSEDFRQMFTAPTSLDFAGMPQDNALVVGPSIDD